MVAYSHTLDELEIDMAGLDADWWRARFEEHPEVFDLILFDVTVPAASFYSSVSPEVQELLDQLEQLPDSVILFSASNDPDKDEPF